MNNEIGRGFSEPVIYNHEDLVAARDVQIAQYNFNNFRDSRPGEYQQLMAAIAGLGRSNVTGKSQRAGMWNSDCVTIARIVKMADPEEEYGMLEHVKNVVMPRKTLRAYTVFENAYNMMISSVNKLVAPMIDHLAGQRVEHAAYAMSNLSGSYGKDLLHKTKLFYMLASSDGVEAEGWLGGKVKFDSVTLPHKYRQDFVKSIKLMGLDYLQTKLAIEALNDITWVWFDADYREYEVVKHHKFVMR